MGNAIFLRKFENDFNLSQYFIIILGLALLSGDIYPLEDAGTDHKGLLFENLYQRVKLRIFFRLTFKSLLNK